MNARSSILCLLLSAAAASAQVTLPKVLSDHMVIHGKFYPAEAKVDGETVIATSPEVAAPIAIRYGWSNSPQCNLFNGDSLPASPFTSVQ